MRRPRISVITPAYNAAGTLAEAVDSVVAQTLVDWEMIVVDDGSTDATAEVAARFSDGRIRVMRQERKGVSAARNTGVAQSRGGVLAFLDADDRFAPTKLAVQASLLERRPEVGAVYCAHRRVDARGLPWTMQAPPSEVGFAELYASFPFNPSAQMVRREWHERIGGFQTGLELHEDRDYWLRQCAAGCRFVRAPGVLLDYRLGPPQPTADPAGKVTQALDALERAERTDAGRKLGQLERDRARFEIFREWAFRAILSGAAAVADDCFQELIALAPDLPRSPERRDELLQAIVDFGVRARGDHEAILRPIFAGLPTPLGELRSMERWAAGCGAVQQGARELLWGGRTPLESGFYGRGRWAPGSTSGPRGCCATRFANTLMRRWRTSLRRCCRP
jgi:glycosyltransferase involved in cell wall biosynthesis